jgi:hypothetical protein
MHSQSGANTLSSGSPHGWNERSTSSNPADAHEHTHTHTRARVSGGGGVSGGHTRSVAPRGGDQTTTLNAYPKNPKYITARMHNVHTPIRAKAK